MQDAKVSYWRSALQRYLQLFAPGDMSGTIEKVLERLRLTPQDMEVIFRQPQPEIRITMGSTGRANDRKNSQGKTIQGQGKGTARLERRAGRMLGGHGD